MNLTELSVAQLKRAAALKEQIERLQKDLTGLLGGSPAPKVATKKKRRLSAAGRAAIIAATKARWAKFKKAAKTAVKPKRKVSPAARARLSALAKARWAKAKAQGKARL